MLFLLKDEVPLMNLIKNLEPSILLLGREYLNSKDQEIINAIEAIKK